MSTRYPFPDLNTLPEDIRTRIVEVQEKAGFIPNVFLAFARRPAEWRAFFAYHDALMLKEEGSLTKGEREQGVATVSAPVFGMHWRLMGSVCISGPASRLPAEKLEALAQTVMAAATQLSYALAGNTAAPAQSPVRATQWHP